MLLTGQPEVAEKENEGEAKGKHMQQSLSQRGGCQHRNELFGISYSFPQHRGSVYKAGTDEFRQVGRQAEVLLSAQFSLPGDLRRMWNSKV